MALAILVGLPGVGKSSVGAAAALSLGCPFIDLDVVIAQVAGLPAAADVIETRGIEAFRDLEASCLHDALTQPAIVATGGGVVELFRNRQELRQHGQVLWLDCGDEQILPRVTGSHRPLLGDDPRGAVAALRRRREMLYREVASEHIDAGRTLADVVDSVVESVSGWTS